MICKLQEDNMNNIKVFDKSGIQDMFRADIGSAGFDIRSNEAIVIPPNQYRLIKTGLYIELPIGMELQIRSRSGLALNYGIHILNGLGTVDSTYRGEIGVILKNDSTVPFNVDIGDRIAQGIFAEYIVPTVSIVESEDCLSETDRGKGGFGHSGI
jgi:dUTP pyrophosphatase